MSIASLTKNCPTPLELLNLYYSDGESLGNRGSTLWRKMNGLLSWENMLEHGYQTDLCPLLYCIITKTLPELNKSRVQQQINSAVLVPEQVLSVLQDQYKSSLLRNIILLDELKKIVAGLKSINIKTVVLKGAYLAENFYDDIASRPMGDLDILIQEKDLKQSEEFLEGRGYIRLPDNDEICMLHSRFCKVVMGQDIIIELHFRLVKEVYRTKFDLDNLWTAGQLPPELKLAYLSWHGVRHGFSRLIWLCDIAHMLKKQQQRIRLDAVHRNGSHANVEWQFIFAFHAAALLFLPLAETCYNHGKNFLRLRLSEILFFNIQQKVCKKVCEKRPRTFLNLNLMRRSDLLKFIPAYIRYKHAEQAW